MYSLSPRALPMLCPLELQRHPVLPLLIAFRSHHPIHLFLVHLISCIQRPRPVVEVNLVVPRLGQYPCQVVNYDPSDRWPMGGETPRPSKYVRILTHGVKGNEPPHARPHNEGMLSIRQGSVSLIYKRLHLREDELQVVI